MCYYDNDNDDDCIKWNKCLQNYLIKRNLNSIDKNEDIKLRSNLQDLFISDIFESELFNRNMIRSNNILNCLNLNNKNAKQHFIESLKPFIHDLTENLGIFTSNIIINEFKEYLKSFNDKLERILKISENINNEINKFNLEKIGNPIEIIKKNRNFQTLSIWNHRINYFQEDPELNKDRWIIFINLANILLNNILNNSYGLNETESIGGSVLKKYKKRSKKRSKKHSKKRKLHKSRKSRKLHRR